MKEDIKKIKVFLEKLIKLEKKDKSKVEYIRGYIDAKLTNKK